MSGAAKYIQPGYTAITPYLYAKLDLIDFLKRAFGAEVTHNPAPGEPGNFHAEAKIGDAHLLLGNGYFSDPFDGRRSLHLRSRCRRNLQARSKPGRGFAPGTGRSDLGRSGCRSERLVGQHLVDSDAQAGELISKACVIAD